MYVVHFANTTEQLRNFGYQASGGDERSVNLKIRLLAQLWPSFQSFSCSGKREKGINPDKTFPPLWSLLAGYFPFMLYGTYVVSPAHSVVPDKVLRESIKRFLLSLLHKIFFPFPPPTLGEILWFTSFSSFLSSSHSQELLIIFHCVSGVRLNFIFCV